MSQSPHEPPASPEIDIKRIQFAPEAAAREKVLRRFTQPRYAMAVEQPAELSDLASSGSLDDLYIVHLPASAPPDMQKAYELWLAAPDRTDAPQPVTIKLGSGSIRWRPGAVVLQSAESMSENLLAALIDFAFFEGELRRLEQSLPPYEVSASADVAVAYRIRQANRAEWERLGEMMENLSRLRLTFVNVEPRLSTPLRSLDPEARRVAERLADAADVPDRLESFSDRLEACEDLYEGAVDRMTDFRAWHKGQVLEIIIVVLLVLEVIAMVLTLFVR